MTEKAIVQVSKHPVVRKIVNLLPDKCYIQLKWLARRMPYRLNLTNPITFNEKLQWIKLYDHNPLYTELVDKFKVKQYVESMLGSDYVIPLLGSWDKIEDIDWDKLPNQFVIKVNHDCGGQIICKDKSKMNRNEVIRKINNAFKRNYYYDSREWPYKNVVPKIFAEKYMEDEFGELRDYKFFCFDGEVRAMYIASDRLKTQETCFDFYDVNFNHLPFTQGHPNAEIQPSKPKGFEKMKSLASKLSKGLPHE